MYPYIYRKNKELKFKMSTKNQNVESNTNLSQKVNNTNNTNNTTPSNTINRQKLTAIFTQNNYPNNNNRSDNWKLYKAICKLLNVVQLYKYNRKGDLAEYKRVVKDCYDGNKVLKQITENEPIEKQRYKPIAESRDGNGHSKERGAKSRNSEEILVGGATVSPRTSEDEYESSFESDLDEITQTEIDEAADLILTTDSDSLDSDLIDIAAELALSSDIDSSDIERAAELALSSDTESSEDENLWDLESLVRKEEEEAEAALTDDKSITQSQIDEAGRILFDTDESDHFDYELFINKYVKDLMRGKYPTIEQWNNLDTEDRQVIMRDLGIESTRHWQRFIDYITQTTPGQDVGDLDIDLGTDTESDFESEDSFVPMIDTESEPELNEYDAWVDEYAEALIINDYPDANEWNNELTDMDRAEILRVLQLKDVEAWKRFMDYINSHLTESDDEKADELTPPIDEPSEPSEPTPESTPERDSTEEDDQKKEESTPEPTPEQPEQPEPTPEPTPEPEPESDFESEKDNKLPSMFDDFTNLNDIPPDKIDDLFESEIEELFTYPTREISYIYRYEYEDRLKDLKDLVKWMILNYYDTDYVYNVEIFYRTWDSTNKTWNIPPAVNRPFSKYRIRRLQKILLGEMNSMTTKQFVSGTENVTELKTAFAIRISLIKIEKKAKKRKRVGYYFDMVTEMYKLDLMILGVHNKVQRTIHFDENPFDCVHDSLNPQFEKGIGKATLESLVPKNVGFQSKYFHDIALNTKTSIQLKSVRYDNGKPRTTDYGNNKNPKKYVGWINDHYFRNDDIKIPITSYALKHYHEIDKAGVVEWRNVIRKRKSGYEVTSKPKYLTPFKCMSLLMKNKDKLLHRETYNMMTGNMDALDVPEHIKVREKLKYCQKIQMKSGLEEPVKAKEMTITDTINGVKKKPCGKWGHTYESNVCSECGHWDETYDMGCDDEGDCW